MRTAVMKMEMETYYNQLIRFVFYVSPHTVGMIFVSISTIATHIITDFMRCWSSFVFIANKLNNANSQFFFGTILNGFSSSISIESFFFPSGWSYAIKSCKIQRKEDDFGINSMRNSLSSYIILLRTRKRTYLHSFTHTLTHTAIKCKILL